MDAVAQGGLPGGQGFFNYLVSEIRTRREVPLEEAVLAARDVLEYLERNLLTRAPGQIVFPAISGRENHQKRSRSNQPEKLVSLTVVAEEDIELMAEFGTVAFQRGRLARLLGRPMPRMPFWTFPGFASCSPRPTGAFASSCNPSGNKELCCRWPG